MQDDKLFRAEVLEQKRHKNLGTIFMNTPLHYQRCTIGVTALLSLLIFFLIYADFAEKTVVTGFINSSQGIVQIFPRKLGIIVRNFCTEGMQVKKGDPLFVIDTSYDGLNQHKRPSILDQLEKKQRTIAREIGHKKREVQVLRGLAAKKYLSTLAYNAKYEELLNLEKEKNTVDTEVLVYKEGASYIIRAPVDGMIASLFAQAGQYIGQSKPLAKILPRSASLVAELFVPVKQSGFLSKKNRILIHYDAYPYERFGAYEAVIHDIGRSVLTDVEEEKPMRVGQPYYKVTAFLKSPFVQLYGAHKKIQHGMTVSAVIIGERRKIWQWIFDPLYSFYGNRRA